MKKTIMLILGIMCYVNFFSKKMNAQVFQIGEIREEVISSIPFDEIKIDFIEKRIKAFNKHMKYVRSNSLSFEKKKSKFISNLYSLLGSGLTRYEDYILNSSETHKEYLKNLQVLISVYESEKRQGMRRKR